MTEQPAPSDFPSEADHDLLRHLLDLAELRTERFQHNAVGLQERSVKVGGVAAVALGLVLNAAAAIDPGGAPGGWLLAGGAAALALALLLSTAGYQPLTASDVGDLNEWRAWLAREGARDTTAALIAQHERLLDGRAGLHDRLAKQARAAHAALATGLVGASLGLAVTVLGR